VRDCAVALLLTAVMSLSGIFLSGRALSSVQNSAIYRQSQIIGSVFSQQDVGFTDIVTNPTGRGLLLKFAEALANAYVNFELIPYNEVRTFTVVYQSLAPAVEIENFAYQRRDLIITGSAVHENGYLEFLHSLRSQGHFGQVTGSFHTTAESYVRFEIKCAAAV